MTETVPHEPPTLSTATQASVQGLVRAKHEVEQWTHNLEQALADDVAADPPRLTPDEAAQVAKQNGVNAPPKPGDKTEAVETTAEANQAQLDAHTKVAEAEAAKDAEVAAAAAAKAKAEAEAGDGDQGMHAGDETPPKEKAPPEPKPAKDEKAGQQKARQT